MAKKRDLNWNDLRFLLALARSSSLAGAARRLAVNESTVARRLAEAEARLGARLFERSLGAFSPTEAGRAALAGAERVEREVQAVEAAVSGTDRLAAGLVRVTSVPLVVNRLLMPALVPLLRAHPQLRIELIAEPRDLNLTRREADIALRLARPAKELRAVARRIGRLDYGVYAPTRKAHGDLPWITYEDAMTALPQWRWMAAQAAEGEVAPPVTVNDAEAILQGIKAGLGKSLLPLAVAEREPGLRRLDPGPPALSRELWLMVHPELRSLTRVRVVMDWLAGVAAGISEASPLGAAE